MSDYCSIDDYTTEELFQEIKKRFAAKNEIIYEQAKKLQALERRAKEQP